jgi:hypothetical protein
MPRFNPLKPTKPARPQRPEPLPKGTIPSPELVSHAPFLSENEAKNGLELRFRTKPDDKVLAAFHGTQQLPPEHRWHWHRSGRYWYAKRNDVTCAFAAAIVGDPTPAPVAPPIREQNAHGNEHAPSIPSTKSIESTESISQLPANIIPVNFTAAPVNAPAAPVAIKPGPIPPVPAWRARLIRSNQSPK